MPIASKSVRRVPSPETPGRRELAGRLVGVPASTNSSRTAAPVEPVEQLGQVARSRTRRAEMCGTVAYPAA